MINIKNLTLKNKEIVLLDNVNIDINDKEIVFIKAKNGKGKTSLLNFIAKISQNNLKNHYDKFELKHSVGYVMQNAEKAFSPFYKLYLQVSEHAYLTKKIKNSNRFKYAEKVFASFSISHELLNKYSYEVSGGQRAKIMIATILSQGHKILLLDEPTAAFDDNNEKEFALKINNYIKQNNACAIWISHNEKIITKNATKVLRITKNAKIKKQKISNNFTKSRKINVTYNAFDDKIIDFKNVYLNYGNIPVLKNINFCLHKDEFLGLKGSNGQGKSSIFKLITDQIKPTRGCINSSQDIHMIYQNPIESLNPALNVYKNIIDPLLCKKIDPKISIYLKKINKLLKLFSLNDEILKKLPNQLSGGQQQKVCIVRALINLPKILLLDEPSAALDDVSIKKLEKYLKSIKKYTSSIIISHDNEFLENVSDRIIKIENGQIVN